MVLKSGKICTAGLMVLKKVTWPHKLIYTAKGKFAQCEDLSVSLFVSGYMAVIDTENPALRLVMKKHLKELMSDFKFTAGPQCASIM